MTQHPFLLKWPRGSLIFPEINSPEKINEVFLLDEYHTSYPDRYDLYWHFGSQFFSSKKYIKAKKYYLEASTIQADNPIINKRLGFLFMNSKDFKGAEAAYRKLLEIAPEYTPAIAQLGICLAAQKKYSLAEKYLKRAILREPTNVNYHLNLGNYYYFLRRNYRGARRSYHKALQLNPRLAEARKNLRDIDQIYKNSREQENSFENSWGSDSVSDSPNESGPATGASRSREGDNVTRSLEQGNVQRPLF